MVSLRFCSLNNIARYVLLYSLRRIYTILTPNRRDTSILRRDFRSVGREKRRRLTSADTDHFEDFKYDVGFNFTKYDVYWSNYPWKPG